MKTPQEMFEGVWKGEGVIAGGGPLGWLMPKEPFTITTKFERISEKFWVVRDHLVFTRGGEMKRTMFLEQTAPNRCHVTADDMPLGSDIEVTERGYSYTPYWSWAAMRGRRWFVRIREEGDFQSDGSIKGRIRVYWHGIPMARNEFVLRKQ